METTLAATEDTLVESLSFRLPSSANYVVDKSEDTFFPSNGNSFAPNGVKIIRFSLTGDKWLDPRSVRLQYKLKNNDANYALYPINALPANFFRRLRILCGGTLVEDIEYSSRLVNMMHTLFPKAKRLNDQVEGFGKSKKVDDFDSVSGIQALDERVVTMPILCGLFTQEKHLPLRFLQNLMIELEVVNNFSDPVLSPVVGAPTGSVPTGVGAFSTNWTISEAQIKCTTLTLDSALNNEYYDRLMSGAALPIAFTSFVQQIQTVTAAQTSISLSRAFTRLNKVFLTFYKTPYIWRQADAPNQTTGIPVNTQIPATHVPLKEANFFYHPQYIYQYAGPTGDPTNPPLDWGRTDQQSKTLPFSLIQGFEYQGNASEPEIQVQLGSKQVPTLPARSAAEMYYQLRKSILGRDNSSSEFDISESQYRTFKFITCFDFQKVDGVFSSGTSTKTGDLLTIKIRNMIHRSPGLGEIDGTVPEFMYVTYVHDAVLNITDAGCTVME